jgi:NRAMP (natural resistance-associated macrophage protein)-like metal ion transporter
MKRNASGSGPEEKKSRFRSFLKMLGPGIVTGASDDDPSGITTYSQAGAQFGLATLWTAIVTFPLMAAVQEMCARVGMVTTKGLAGTLKQHYPKWIIWLMVLASFPAIILNIGADIAGMGAVANMIAPAIPSSFFCTIFTVLMLAGIIYFPYQKFAAILKWFCAVLLVYLIVPFFVKTDWHAVLLATVKPQIRFDKSFVNMLVAILGTTISPYLFFWQATMEAEDVQKKSLVIDKHVLTDLRIDVNVGMFFSNLVMFFIILTCGNVLFPNGGQAIQTVEQAAGALRPIAGNLAYELFALGIIGTGFLAVPVLSGSLSYMFAETFGWREGLDKKFFQAKPFYSVVIVSLVLGLGINYIGITPVQGLIYSATLYGLTAPIMIAVVMHICNNRKIMGERVNGPRSNILGTVTLVLMTAAAAFMIYLEWKGN